MTVELNEKILHDAGIGSFFRPSQLEPLGIPYHRLRQLEKDETVERIGWGLYRLAAADLTMSYSAALVSARVPNSIICLLSALQAHEIGTQLPHQIWLAIPHKAKPPVLPYLATRLVRFSGAAWTYGVRETEFEGVPARITSPARTVVDCFRFQRLIGREAAIEALREALWDGKVTTAALTRTLEELPSRSLRTILESGIL